MKSVYPHQSDFKSFSGHNNNFFPSVIEFYSYFVTTLIADPALILKLFRETRTGVEVFRNGTYRHKLICGTNNNGSNCYELKIQRVILRSSDGTFLYSRSILPGLVIPYSSYSLQFVLYCLSRYYAIHSITKTCRATGVGPRQLRRWIKCARENPELIEDFFKQDSAQKAICPGLSAFLSMAANHAFAELLKSLYMQLCARTSPCSRWTYMLPDCSKYM